MPLTCPRLLRAAHAAAAVVLRRALCPRTAHLGTWGHAFWDTHPSAASHPEPSIGCGFHGVDARRVAAPSSSFGAGATAFSCARHVRRRGLPSAVSRGEPQRGFRRDYRLSTPPAALSYDDRIRRGPRSASPSVCYPATRATRRAAGTFAAAVRAVPSLSWVASDSQITPPRARRSAWRPGSAVR